MAYWLMKSEPGNWSWEDQVRDGVAEWDGVRNYQAANNMKAMKVGDRVFFYHSVKEKQVVGIVEVVGTYYPDPSDASGRFGMVDVKAIRRTLEEEREALAKASAATAEERAPVELSGPGRHRR